MQPQVVIITGAASGIGKHWASVLATRPDEYRLVLADVNEAGLHAAFTASELLRLHRLDVRSTDDWQALIRHTMQSFGRIDCLFNIAGGGRLGFLLDQPIENIDLVIDLNLKGPIYGMRLAGQVMATQRAGHIVNVASLAGLSATPGNALYSAAKAGLRSASLAAAVELRKFGVYVTVVAPDVVNTPAVRHHFRYPEAAALIHSGSKLLEVEDVEQAFWRALRERPLEITLPRWRGWLAKLNNVYPPLMLRLYGPLSRRGRKRLERLRMKREA